MFLELLQSQGQMPFLPRIRGYAEGPALRNARNEAWLKGDLLRLLALVKINQALTFAGARKARRGVEDAEHPTG